MLSDDRYEDGVGSTSGSGGDGSHKRVSWNTGRVRFADDEEFHDPWSKKGKGAAW